MDAREVGGRAAPGRSKNVESRLRGILLFGAVILLISASAGLLTGYAEAQLEPLPIRLTGQSCADWPEGQSCLSGLCIDVSPFGAVCSHYCIEDLECPDGWGCANQREGNGSWVSYCRPRRIGAGE
jgi:hypothetical protein